MSKNKLDIVKLLERHPNLTFRFDTLGKFILVVIEPKDGQGPVASLSLCLHELKRWGFDWKVLDQIANKVEENWKIQL